MQTFYCPASLHLIFSTSPTWTSTSSTDAHKWPWRFRFRFICYYHQPSINSIFYFLVRISIYPRLTYSFKAPIPFESLTPLVSLPILYAISKWVLYRRCLASTLLIRNLYGSIGLVPVDKTVNDRATQVLDGIDVAVLECVSKSQKDHTKVHWVPIKPLCALARLNHLRIPDFVKSVTRARQKHQRRMLIELDWWLSPCIDSTFWCVKLI